MLVLDGWIRWKISGVQWRGYCEAATINKREYDRGYYDRNKDLRKLHSRDYYLRTKAYKQEYQKQYYVQHKDVITKLIHDTYARNQDSKREYARKYYLRNKIDGNVTVDNEDKIGIRWDQSDDDKKARSHRYYLKNKDRRSELTRDSKREYYLLHQNKRIDYTRDYYTRNKDTKRRSSREQYLSSKEDPDFYSPRDMSVRSWKTASDVREFFDEVAKQLHITDHSDWYRIARPQISSLGGVFSPGSFLFLSLHLMLKADTCTRSLRRLDMHYNMLTRKSAGNSTNSPSEGRNQARGGCESKSKSCCLE
jgi:hypothetical protein